MLDKTSIKILKFIKNTRPDHSSDISKLVPDENLLSACLDSLTKKGMINESSVSVSRYGAPFPLHKGEKYILISSTPYEITPDGIAYLEALEREQPQTIRGKVFKWVRNNALELVAIIISIIALLKP